MALSSCPTPRLLAIADHGSCTGAEDWRSRSLRLADALQRLDSPRVCMQVRLKKLAGAPRLAALAGLRAALDDRMNTGLRVSLNGSTDEALELGFDEVHWPENSIEQAPATTGSLVASASVHSLAAARRARAAGVVYVVFGPVFNPSTKKRAGVGVNQLAALAAEQVCELVAVGGLRPDRVPTCIQAGATGVAVVSDLLGAADIHSRVREYWSILAAPTPGSRCQRR